MKFEEAMKQTEDTAREYDCMMYLYKERNDDGWFVSHNLWHDWLYEVDEEGHGTLSTTGQAIKDDAIGDSALLYASQKDW